MRKTASAHLFSLPGQAITACQWPAFAEKTDTLCLQLQNPQPHPVSGNVFGSFTQFPCSAEQPCVSSKKRTRWRHKSRSNVFTSATIIEKIFHMSRKVYDKANIILLLFYFRSWSRIPKKKNIFITDIFYLTRFSIWIFPFLPHIRACSTNALALLAGCQA